MANTEKARLQRQRNDLTKKREALAEQEDNARKLVDEKEELDYQNYKLDRKEHKINSDANIALEAAAGRVNSHGGEYTVTVSVTPNGGEKQTLTVDMSNAEEGDGLPKLRDLVTMNLLEYVRTDESNKFNKLNANRDTWDHRYNREVAEEARQVAEVE